MLAHLVKGKGMSAADIPSIHSCLCTSFLRSAWNLPDGMYFGGLLPLEISEIHEILELNFLVSHKAYCQKLMRRQNMGLCSVIGASGGGAREGEAAAAVRVAHPAHVAQAEMAARG